MRAEIGKIDAELDGNLIKQRVARPGKGRSGGYRTVIAYRAKTLSVFVYGFSKNQRDNITEVELSDLRKLADNLLALTEIQIAHALAEGELIEVANDEKN